MTAKIVLTFTQGKWKGREIAFEGNTLCTIGRSEECHVRLPSDPDLLDVSRRHCLLAIDPPEARVCDLGSLNGTYVNGVKIGSRQRGTHPAERRPPTGTDVGPAEATEVLLRDGDEVRVGGVVFRVGVVYPLACSGCGTELHDQDKSPAAAPLCDWCRLAVGPAAAHPEQLCGAGAE
jgi:serine/threonine-protein kinase